MKKSKVKHISLCAGAFVMLCLIVALIFIIYDRMENATSVNQSTVSLDESVYTSEQLNQPSIEGKCPNYFFPCKESYDELNQTNCIHRSLHCNKKADCPNGEDEKNCAYIPPDIRFNYNVSSVNTTSWNHKNLFGNCSIYDVISGECGCNISHATRGDCKGRNLTEIPDVFAKSIISLNLDKNKITFIDPVKLNLYPNLNSLSLRYNRIEVLYSGTFKQMSKLRKLYLRGNLISFVTSDALEGLTSLEKLYLTENELEWIDLNMFVYTPNLNFVDLSENRLKLFSSQTFPSLTKLTWLDVSFNRIEKISNHLLTNLINLEKLHLQDNQITAIHSNSFKNQSKLSELNLNNNAIYQIPSKLFSHQTKSLSTLEMANNLFQTLPVNLFKNLQRLSMLNLTGIEIRNINQHHFRNCSNLTHLYLLRFKYCLYAPQVRVCLPSSDGISSLGHLLVHPIVRVCVWIVAISTCIGNITVLTWRSLSRKEDLVLSLLVKNLSLADLLMGFYLIFVGAKDVAFQDKYSIHALEWMNSWTCAAVGIIAMTSCEVSVMILTIVAIERYRSIAYATRLLTLKSVRALVAFSWIISLAIALCPIIYPWQEGESGFYGSNGLCFPLHIDDPYAQGWQYSAFIFLGVNFLAVMSMLVFYTRMFIILNRDRATTHPGLIDKAYEDRILAIRFFAIVLTDCLCWLPIVLIKVLAFLPGQEISATIYAWVVVFILPINSAINPIIYTIAAPTSIRNKLLTTLHTFTTASANLFNRAIDNKWFNWWWSWSSRRQSSQFVHRHTKDTSDDTNVFDEVENSNKRTGSDGSCVSLITMSTSKTTNSSLSGSRRSSGCTITTNLVRIQPCLSACKCSSSASEANLTGTSVTLNSTSISTASATLTTSPATTATSSAATANCCKLVSKSEMSAISHL